MNMFIFFIKEKKCINFILDMNEGMLDIGLRKYY